jgi:hypothetical protein
MTIASFVAVVLAGLGLFVAVLFGASALRQLAQVRRTPPLGGPARAGADPSDSSDPANDVPTMRFKGEAFERDWQGSRGYARPETANEAIENWTDRLIIPVVTPLRPSRFSDPSYWTRYLPRVLGIWFLFFVVLPLVIVATEHSTNGTRGTFSPSAAQLSVPARSSDYVSDPGACDASHGGNSASGQPVSITDADNGNVFSVRPGGLIAVTYYYGKPVLSPGVPLCDPTGLVIRDTSRSVEYQVTGSGTGYVYIPQPTGTIVAEIEVASDHSAVVYVLLGLTAVVLCVDIVLMVRLRRETRVRWTRV